MAVDVERIVGLLAGRRARLAGSSAWFARHKQRLVYLLLAASAVAAIGAAAAGGFFLHRAASIERETLRAQHLAGAAFRLQIVTGQAQAAGATKQLAGQQKQALAATDAAFQAIRAHERGESDRLAGAYRVYIAGSTREFRQAARSGRVSGADQRRLDGQLNQLESLIETEVQRQARETRTANPEARLAVIAALGAAVLLLGLLIWQFNIERRAGRIDRDNVARSQELIRIRDEFVSAVSHELRTPLTSIIGYLDLLEENELGNLTSDQQSFIAVAQRGSNRLFQLVGDLLLIAETDGPLALDVKELDLAVLAETCVEAAKPLADAKQIELSLTPGSVRRIEGDPIRLAQVMDNLVSNAIKFTPPGGRVNVRLVPEPDHLLFEVTDSGYGISLAEQEQLFDRFFRTRVAIDEAIAGTGLGLTITKAIVGAHHGSITVESTVGKGSTFAIRLPYVH